MGAAGVLVGLIPSFLMWSDRRSKRRSMDYREEFVDVVGPGNPFHGDLQIVFQGQNVIDAALIRITIENTGAASLQVSDFSAPVYISVPEPAEVLAYQFGRAEQGKLEPRATLGLLPGTSIHALAIDPLLLNPKDRLSVSLLVKQYGGEGVQVVTSILGISEIKDNTLYFPTRKENFRRMTRFWVANISVIFLIIWSVTTTRPEPGLVFFPFDHPFISWAVTLAFVMAVRAQHEASHK